MFKNCTNLRRPETNIRCSQIASAVLLCFINLGRYWTIDTSYIFYAQLWTCIFNLRGRLGTRIPEIAGTKNLVPRTLTRVLSWKTNVLARPKGLVAAPMSDVAASAGDVPAASAAMGG